MTKDDIIRMALEAKADYDDEVWLLMPDELERFAALVADAKEAEHKEAMRWDIHSCGPTCKRYACVATREAVAAEREACAQVCDSWSLRDSLAADMAEEIRARGNT